MEKVNIYISALRRLGPILQMDDSESVPEIVYNNDYSVELKNLQQNAYNELITFSVHDIMHTLRSLKRFKAQFMKFDEDYPGLVANSEAGFLSYADLRGKIHPLLNLVGIPETNISFTLLKVLYSSILYKYNSLLDLINRTEDFLVTKKKKEIKRTKII
jgi:hypothetical protein